MTTPTLDKARTTHMLMYPKNRREQIIGVVNFVSDATGIDHRLTEADMMHIFVHHIFQIAVLMFKDNDVRGYRAMVIREALKSIEKTGEIDLCAEPWEMPVEGF